MIETENDKIDAITLLANRLVDQACRALALAKEKQTNVEAIVYVDDEGNDALAYAYDYKTAKMTSSMTLDKLAQEEYGDPSLGTLLAYYNKIQNEHTVPAGAQIRVPVLARQSANLNNRIYANLTIQMRIPKYEPFLIFHYVFPTIWGIIFILENHIGRSGSTVGFSH